MPLTAPDPRDTARCYGPLVGGRDDFNRDAQRIIHSTRFRKLQDKMEIGLPGFGGDGRRTALTLTMEVVSMASSDCRMYGLDHDLALAIGLAQRLGAPPYGRTGAKFISQAMGRPFNQHEYALYILTHIPSAYPQHPGLNPNPTCAVRDALIRMARCEGFELTLPLDEDLDPTELAVTLEGILVEGYSTVVRAADYFEDFVNSRTISLSQLADILEEQEVFHDLYGTASESVERVRDSAREGLFRAELVPNITKAILSKGARPLEDAIKDVLCAGWRWGLSQARRYVKYMGGRIECFPIDCPENAESPRFEPAAKGPAYFRIEFPNKQVQPKQAADALAVSKRRRQARLDLDPARSSGEILVIDHSPRDQRKVCRMLTELGYQPRVESSFECGAEIIRNSDPYAAILDADLRPTARSSTGLLGIFR